MFNSALSWENSKLQPGSDFGKVCALGIVPILYTLLLQITFMIKSLLLQGLGVWYKNIFDNRLFDW